MDFAELAQQAIEAYNRASRELASLHRERGDVASKVGADRTRAYQDAVVSGGTVSDARHAADMASSSLQSEVTKLDGEIAGLAVELRYLDQLLAHYRWMADLNARER